MTETSPPADQQLSDTGITDTRSAHPFMFLYFAATVAFPIFAVITLAWGAAFVLSASQSSSVVHLIVGVLFLLVAVGFVVWAVWLGRRGMRLVAQTPIAGVDDVTGPLPHLEAPAPITDVVKALKALNLRGLPYRVDITPGKRGQMLATFRMRVEETRWKSMFGTGVVKRTWVLRVKLKPTGHYTWLEKTGTVMWDARLRRATLSMQRSVFVGKDLSAGAVKQVWTPNEQLSRTVRGSDVKIPVFTILRSYGWRPRHDWWGVRMWEY